MHYNKCRAVFVSFLVLMVSTSAYANHYGMAGCGVGSRIFKDKPGKIQILAGTTNQFLEQSFSLSSGSSGCREHADKVAALFITVNQNAVKSDIARGNGETLNGLAEIYECQNSEPIGRILQENFQSIYNGSDMSAEQEAKNIQSILKRDAQVRKLCSTLS